LTTMTDFPNGYYMLPPGRLANAVIWLEMRAPPRLPLAAPIRLINAKLDGGVCCAGLFTEIGTPWLWSRAAHSPALDLANTYSAVDDKGRQVGLVEFSETSTDMEIVYFGLVPMATGAGLGRRLMAAALDVAWRTADRVWLHTCSFDHPGALRFYQSCGFVPYASGFELMDDPRMDNSLPANAAPHVPLIGREGRLRRQGKGKSLNF
jgi:GNAT superfamily N-acetyltransferase